MNQIPARIPARNLARNMEQIPARNLVHIPAHYNISADSMPAYCVCDLFE